MSRSLFVLIILILLALWLFFGAKYLSNRFCGEGVTENTTAVAPVAAPVKSKLACTPWNFRDGSALNVKSDCSYKFLKNRYQHLQPKNKSLNNAISETSRYLKTKPGRKLVITGLYNKDEKNTGAFENLGLARANSVKNALVKTGVKASQLDISGKLMNLSFKRDTLYKGVDFTFSELGDNKGRLAAIKNRLFGKPLTLYFPTGKNEVVLNGQQRKDMADLVYYLDNVNASKLEISGHTDNVGNKAANTKLSKQRADFARNYLRGNGISNGRMESIGHGPDKPIAPNSTDAGKQKNRRVEVLLK